MVTVFILLLRKIRSREQAAGSRQQAAGIYFGAIAAVVSLHFCALNELIFSNCPELSCQNFTFAFNAVLDAVVGIT